MKNAPKRQNRPDKEHRNVAVVETVDFVRNIVNDSRSIAAEIIRNKRIPGAKLTPLAKSRLYC